MPTIAGMAMLAEVGMEDGNRDIHPGGISRLPLRQSTILSNVLLRGP